MVAEAAPSQKTKLKKVEVNGMESASDFLAFELSAPTDAIEGIVLTEEQRNELAERIDRVILERKRIAIRRRMQARLRQLQSIERAQERYRALGELCCEGQVNAG
jgi:hypothetical protein